MPSRTVITRTRRGERERDKDFVFTREMVPGLAKDPALARDGKAPGFIKAYRERAWEAFTSQPMPSTRQEAWRRTDLRSMPTGSFRLPENGLTNDMVLATPPVELLQPNKPLADESHGGQIMLTPSGSEVKLEPELAAKGVVFCDLSTAEQEHAEVLEGILGQVVSLNEGKFAAMAAAFSHQGVLLYVPPGVKVERPLHSVMWGPGMGLAHFSHILVWVGEGASVTYVHESASSSKQPGGRDDNQSNRDGQSLHAGLVEIRVETGAKLNFVELQSWGEAVWNFSHERARIERDANLDWVFGAIGSRLTKNFSDIDLVGRGAHGRMSGFYFTDGVQHLDHDTQQNHLAPDTTSDLLFKGALKENSRSVWQGMIYVAPGAQKTDGYQANRNLVLSPDARADSIPGLEILADDVRCTHGATVGKIDADQIFYSRSRGIPYQEAERLIVEGFFDPIMQRIPFEGVRSRFQNAIMEKMG